MRRIHVYISELNYKFLKNLPGQLSEHIRRAIDEYVVKVKTQDISASVSKSKEGKEGEQSD